MLPLAYLTVPNATFIISLDPPLLFGSYTKSSITNELFGLIATFVLSTNFIPTLPFPVRTLSLNSIPEFFFKVSLFFDLSTEAFPFCFTTLPMVSDKAILLIEIKSRKLIVHSDCNIMS